MGGKGGLTVAAQTTGVFAAAPSPGGYAPAHQLRAVGGALLRP